MSKFSIYCFIMILFFTSCGEVEVDKRIPGSFKSLQQMTHSRSYPNEDIPSSAYFKAFEKHEKFRNTSATKSNIEPWRAMGPLNTTGRTLSLDVNPQDPFTIYAGSASGGLWRSRELGQGVSWEYVETRFPVLGVSDIEFAPGDSTVMFIGTGEVYNYYITGNDGAYRATRGSYGMGILKSEDGGASWSKSLDWTYQNQRGVWMIKVAHSNTQVVYAATTEGVYKSVDQGETWSLILDVIMGTDISVNPEDENDVVAVFGNFGTPGKGFYRTTDGGITWDKIVNNIPPDFNGKIQIDRSTSDPSILYASVGNGFSGNEGATWTLKSEDYGASWNLVNTTDYSRWQGWFSHDIAIHPEDPNEIIAIGIDIHKSTDGGLTIERQSNGGVTLGTPEIGGADGPNNYSHSDHHFVTYHPALEDVVLFGNDGGFFVSYDGGETFASANGGMQTTQFYNGFSVSQNRPDFAMGGLQDNSTSIFNGDGRWTRAIGGDGSWTAINDEDLIIFGSYQNLNIARSLNFGGNFQFLDLNKESDDFPLFIAPYVVAPSNPSTMYAGSNYLYKSENSGASWTTASKLGDNPIYAMEVSMIDENTIYAGTSPILGVTGDTPKLYVSTDGGSSWKFNEFDLPDRIPNDISTHPTDPGTAYVCFSGFGTNHLYKTEDYGDSWIAIDNGIPDVPGNAIIVDPFNPDHIYFGNDIGVYFSEDGGNSWRVWSEGMPMAAVVLDLKISGFDQSIWVATHGNGTYKRELESTNINTSTSEIASTHLKVYPNPTSDLINITFDTENNTFDVLIFSIDGSLIHSQKRFPNNTNIDVSQLENGVYVMKLIDQQKEYQTQLIKI